MTDSTAYLPPDVAQRLDIVVVPLKVDIDGASYAEDEASPSAVASALDADAAVTTSRPAPAVFADAYATAAAGGATAVVSVHLSAKMSGTCEAATVAARQAPLPVRVVDSGGLGMALGFPAITAGEAALAGADLSGVVAAAQARAAATTSLFYVERLEHLRRGGRIGAAAALVGSALAVKPLLHVVDGRVALLDKVRTPARALARLEELAVQRAGSGPVDVAVQHLASEARAEQLASRLRVRLEHLGDLYVAEVGAVVGAHVGPGMIGVVVAPR